MPRVYPATASLPTVGRFTAGRAQPPRRAVAGGAAPSTAAEDAATYLSADELVVFSAEQRVFLVRKRKAALGLGPIMPPGCEACDSIGTCQCHQCGGSGRNATDKAEELFAGGGYDIIKTNNGLVDPRWLMMKGGPCWLCKGQQHLPCRDCSGTGIKGGVDRYSGD